MSGAIYWVTFALAGKVFPPGEAEQNEKEKGNSRDGCSTGRRVSFILKRRLAREVICGSLAPSEGAGYDLIDEYEQKWEVRSISKDGIYFCPSYMVGSGRSFNDPGFMRKMKDIKGYIVSDIESFSDIPWWIIPAFQVKLWWQKGKLGKTIKITRKQVLSLIIGTV